MADNPRRLRVASDDESVTLYQAFPNEVANAAVNHQSLLNATGFQMNRMTWFKTSFTQMMHVSDYGYRDSKRSRILAFRVSYAGLQDALQQAALSYNRDAKSGGYVDTKAPVHIIWDAARTPMGNKSKGKKSMHIGISGVVLYQIVNEHILAIADVTEQAYNLKLMVDRHDQAGAEKFIKGLEEEDLPLDDEETEGRLGML